jgi:hypothetical protein
MVRKESNCESGMIAKNWGFTGPVSVPNGAATWKAAGMTILDPTSPNSA